MYYLKRSCFTKCLSFFKLVYFNFLTQTIALFNYIIYCLQKPAKAKPKDRFRNLKRSFSNRFEITMSTVLLYYKVNPPEQEGYKFNYICIHNTYHEPNTVSNYRLDKYYQNRTCRGYWNSLAANTGIHRTAGTHGRIFQRIYGRSLVRKGPYRSLP